MVLAFLLTKLPTALKFLSRSSPYNSSEEFKMIFFFSVGASSGDWLLETNFSGGNLTLATNVSIKIQVILRYVNIRLVPVINTHMYIPKLCLYFLLIQYLMQHCWHITEQYFLFSPQNSLQFFSIHLRYKCYKIPQFLIFKTMNKCTEKNHTPTLLASS